MPQTDLHHSSIKTVDTMYPDPFGIGKTLLKLQYAWLTHPLELLEAEQECAADAWILGFSTLSYLAGGSPDPCVPVAEGDERFDDPEWHENPAYCLLQQHYLTYTRWLERIVYDTPGAPKKDRRTGAFWTRQWFNALAPSNFLLTNPVAIRKASETGGASIVRGIANLVDDLRAGDLQMVDRSAFQLGKNLAATPGSVVFRNHMMEVIQYDPVRKTVHAVPVVCIPAWINKYYILDLNNEKSLVRHLLSEGFSVFMISWKNPGAEFANKTFDEYMLDGALAAIKVACAICNVPQVHAVGYCIGGTALAALMAWLNREYDDQTQLPVAHWSLLASLADFSRPGEIEAFINDDCLATIDDLMAQRGYLDKREMSWSFRMLRPNSLIWHYFVHKYLYGEKPPAFDALAWNADSTRLPRKLHSFCLHELYKDNKLAHKDRIVIGGYPLDLALVRQPLYAVGTTEDHIVPWRGAFKTVSLVRGPVRFALSTSGHVLGIVNPPNGNSRRMYWAGDATAATDGKAWRAEQQKQAGSWWPDWSAWLHDKCGPMQSPPPAPPPFRKLGEAPGTYVFEQ